MVDGLGSSMFFILPLLATVAYDMQNRLVHVGVATTGFEVPAHRE